MGKVVWRGSCAGIILYASVGIFGYLTFYNKPAELMKQNILLADYGMNWAIIVGQITSFFSVYFAMPLLYLPAKETVEEMLLKGKRRMTMKENVWCTIALILISYVFAIFVPSIGDAMALAGCTTNPMIGFIIPVIMYWGIHKDKPFFSKEKLVSGFVALVIIITSILGLVNFVI